MRALLLILLTLAALPASATYTKMANNGAELPDSVGSIGSGASDWACSRDNATGLIWEVKTSSGLRNQANTYTNYDSSYGTAAQMADATNSLGFVAAVNTASLCGYGEWRMPSKDELLGLVNLTATPTISASYFPNTPSALFWSATPLAGAAASAWDLDFSNGAVYNDPRSLSSRVRLVRSVPANAFALTVSLSGAGSGSVNSGGIACTNSAGTTSGSCTAQRGSGSHITLSATSIGNSVFAGWSGACSGSTPTCTLTLDAAKAVSAAFVVQYAKIAHNGAELPDSARLGSAAEDWACTRDNRSGLIWEVKTTDGGLRDLNKSYTNYDDPTQAQKSDGSRPTQAEIDTASNSLGLVKTVNNSGLCGYGDWHRPSKDELLGIVDSTHSYPSINPTFFPNTPPSYFWSASSYTGYANYAWNVYFYDGSAGQNYRGYSSPVRLVRGGSSLATFALSVSASGAGSGSINSGGINCQRAGGATAGACSAERGVGSSVTLTANPAPGSLFTAWGGACSGATPTCTLSMDAAQAVSAQFDAGPLANGACGLSDGQTLSVAPSTRLCTAGTASSVIASLPRTWRWSCSGYNGGTPAACSATSSLDLFTLAVRKSGSGRVVSSPTGLDCGSACSAIYAIGSQVTLTATPAAGSSFVGWGGACAGNFGLSCSLTLSASLSVTVNTATFTTYSKIANNGAVLPDSALLGSGAGDWACTRANSSGLTWEVKTADGGLRDQNKLYTNYDSNYGSPSQVVAASNSLGFATAVNASVLCGFSDWRMPGVDELRGIIDSTRSSPAINPTYFPNTPSYFFWSGSPYTPYPAFAWGVSFFYDGDTYAPGQSFGYHVRLVRSGQFFGTFGLRLSATGSGSGTLSADDGSLNCVRAAGTTSGVCSNSLFNGATVTLTATPASGSGFSGWGGACSASSGPTCTVTMDAAKSVSAGFSSGAASQSITFNPVSSLAPGTTATLSATASSGLVVSLASSTTEICRVSGFTLSAVAAGICTLSANQAGNASFSPAPQLTQSFSIAAAPLPPGPPTNVVITPGSGSVLFSFAPPANNGGAAITGYTATCTAPGQTTRRASGPSSPLTVRNLTGNVSYQCVLTARNSAGSSAEATPPPVIPTPGKKNSLTPILLLLLD